MTDAPAGPAASPLAGPLPRGGSPPATAPLALPRAADGPSAPLLSPEPPAGALLTVVVPCFNERANVLPLVARLHAALDGLAWEAVFVDDDSPDGTAALLREVARHDRRVRCLRRVGRRGLSSAVIEGALSSSADYVAVMDGDLQHDEAQLPALLAALRGGAEVAVGSRYLHGGTTAGLSGAWRQRLSRGGTALVQSLLPARLTDPMSGMFMLSRPLFERLAPRLTGQGFKILLDLLLSAPRKRTGERTGERGDERTGGHAGASTEGGGTLRVAEVPVRFFEREQGSSKLDALVLLQFAALLLDKGLRGLVPLRFVAFALVGLVGVGVNLLVLQLGRSAGLGFAAAQLAGTVVAMVVNFQVNNVLTYRDARLRGPALWRGLALFMLVCGAGAVADIGIAQELYRARSGWNAAGAAGAAVGVVWNYAISATLVWRRR